MQMTVTIDDELLADAREATGLSESSDIVREAIKALLEREAALAIIRLGGTDPDATAPPRRRFAAE